jgi:alkylhydroperoxidase family enzyme
VNAPRTCPKNSLSKSSRGTANCLAAHSLLGSNAGLAEADIAAARRGDASEQRARAAIRFALAVVAARGGVDDADLERVRGAGFGDGEIAEIVAQVALNVLTNYLNRVADTEIDFPKAPALDAEAA